MISSPGFDFTLESPDEIWEKRGVFRQQVFPLLNFLETKGQVPAFVVEVSTAEDVMEVNDFSLVLKESDLKEIRKRQQRILCIQRVGARKSS